MLPFPDEPLTKEELKLWDNFLIGAAFLNQEGRWLRVNQTLCDFLEYTEQELVKHTYHDITHPSDIGIDRGLTKELLNKERASYKVFKRYITKTNKTVWALVLVTAIFTDTGEFRYLFVQTSPVTLMDDHEKEAENKETLLQEALVTEESIQLENVFFEFLKRRWTWTIGTMLFIFTGSVGIYYNFRTEQTMAKQERRQFQQNIEQIETLVEDNSDSIDEINSNIKIILNELKK